MTQDWTPTAPWLDADVAGEPIADLFETLHMDAGPDGFFDRIGTQHAAQFTDGADTLLVAFEQSEALLRESRQMRPIARGVQNRTDIAQLTMIARHESWFRAPEVYAFFDDLIDDGFFDGFERVVFYGAGAEGYAAAAYSVAAPGAEVVLLQPHATMTPALAGWDDRYPETRHVDFTSRYGYAPAMMETASRGFVLFDPNVTEDFMHAALFKRDGVELIRQRHLGAHAELQLEADGLIGRMLDVVVAGGAEACDLVQCLRPRRANYEHLDRVLDATEAAENDWRSAVVARHGMSLVDTPRFQIALERAEAGLAAAGRSLPTARETADAAVQTNAAATVLTLGGALGAAALAEEETAETEVATPAQVVEATAPETDDSEAVSAAVEEIQSAPDALPDLEDDIIDLPEDDLPEVSLAEIDEPDEVALPEHDAEEDYDEGETVPWFKVHFPEFFLGGTPAGEVSDWPGDHETDVDEGSDPDATPNAPRIGTNGHAPLAPKPQVKPTKKKKKADKSRPDSKLKSKKKARDGKRGNRRL